jgi:hypothetical protein
LDFDMNMPRSKPIIRYNKRPPTKQKRRIPRRPEGSYRPGIHNAQFAALVERIVAYLPHIEERMIGSATLMGDPTSPARQVFRSLNSEDARVKVMRALLEQAKINQARGQEFDEAIDLSSRSRRGEMPMPTASGTRMNRVAEYFLKSHRPMRSRPF